MVPLEPNFTVALLVLLLLSWLWARRRAHTPSRTRGEESLDTVQSWPPQVVRVLTLPERKAYDVLRRALPGHLILAQVPLARFISVPTRHAYAQWLHRAGRLNVDLLVCDASSRAVAAVEIRPASQTARSRTRHQRLAEVLQAAGLAVHVWNEAALPSVAEARKLLTAAGESLDDMAVDAHGRQRLPVPDIQEVLSAGDEFEYNQNEPVPSGYFDDFDAATPQDAAAS